jgi:hypothetical protein
MTFWKLTRETGQRRSIILADFFFFLFTGLVIGAHYSPEIKNQTWRLTGKVNQVDYCQLAQDQDLFHSTTVQVKARIVVMDSSIYLYGCTTGVSANLMAAILDDETSLSEEAKQWLQQLREQGKEAAVRSGAWFTGKFNGKLSSGCWGPAFGLEVKTIEFVEPISFEPEDLNGMSVTPTEEGVPLRRYH